jgi:hypothetical protein
MSWRLWVLVIGGGALVFYGLCCLVSEIARGARRSSSYARAAAADWRIHQITEQARQQMGQAVRDSQR